MFARKSVEIESKGICSRHEESNGKSKASFIELLLVGLILVAKMKSRD